MGREVKMLLAANYYKPGSATQAVEYLSQAGGAGQRARILAGGTDLVIALRERRAKADALVDISDIDELKKIRVECGSLRIGSAATFLAIQQSREVGEICPMLVEAVSQIGAPPIRARATIGGNVANAATAADSIPALLAAEAEAEIAGPGGLRRIPVSQVLAGLNTNSLAADELITAFIIPIRPKARMAFEKIGRRKALAISRINLGLQLELDAAGKISSVAVAVGAVGKTAYRVIEVEDYLRGKALDQATVEGACAMMDETVARNLQGRKTTPYKRKIAAAVLGRALLRIKEGC